MKLSFGTETNKQPNYFLEKIWKGLLDGPADMEESYFHYQGRYIAKFGRGWDGDSLGDFLDPKIHTIRRDLDNEWNSGMDIQLVINLNSPDEFQFAPTLKCQSVQRIQIDYSKSINPLGQAVFIDYQLLDKVMLATLVKNCGFPTVADFFMYFKEDFDGNLIHWTSFKYE